MKSAKVIIEFSFRGGRVPKQVLEQMVMELSGKGDELVKPYKRYDKTLSCRVHYEDYSGVPQVSVLDAIHKPDIMGWFRLGRRKVDEKSWEAV